MEKKGIKKGRHDLMAKNSKYTYMFFNNTMPQKHSDISIALDFPTKLN